MVIPEAVAYKRVALLTQGSTTAATIAGGATEAAGAGVQGVGAAGGALAAGALGMGTLGLKVGAGVYGLEWLKNNWWIPALLIGGLIAYKWIK
jgi:hypothetical protein